MREGNSFSVSTFVGGGEGGYPIPGLDGGTPSQVQTGRVPHPRSGWGGTPSQVWTGEGVLQGTPCPRLDGVPPCPDLGWGVLPCPRLDGVPPVKTWDRMSTLGYPPFKTGWGTPIPSRPGTGGYPPFKTGWGVYARGCSCLFVCLYKIILS